MSRKTTIAISIALVAVFSVSAFAQKGGKQNKQKGGKSRSSHHGGNQMGRGQHHFNSQLGRSQHHFGGKNGNHSNHHNHVGGHKNKTKVHRHNNHNWKQNGHRSGHHNVHNFHWNGHHGNAHHGHNGQQQNGFHYKYVNAQRHFAVRSNLYLVKFHQFPYDVCWHNSKYWVCYNGHWMPYSYLIKNHAGAWKWHQAHYRFHNHSAFKKNFKSGKRVRLSYGN